MKRLFKHLVLGMSLAVAATACIGEGNGPRVDQRGSESPSLGPDGVPVTDDPTDDPMVEPAPAPAPEPAPTSSTTSATPATSPRLAAPSPHPNAVKASATPISRIPRP